MSNPSPRSISDRLSGQHILVTGATGFLAKVFVEKLLRSVETIGGIHLLIRPRSDGASPQERLRSDVVQSRLFDRLRAKLGERFEPLWREKLYVIGGDLSRDRLGLEEETYEALTRRITLVVNSAATVTFDERIDEALGLNTRGPLRLLAFARDCGNVPLLHVSTCYVSGVRGGVVLEDFTAPERAREGLPRRPDTGSFDLDAIVERMTTEAATLKARHGSDSEEARRALVDAGMRAARSLGWNDTYTLTKWLGEQLLLREQGSAPLVIFRPAIIEGSHSEPMPGWIDGLRMADPVIVAYGRGKLHEFPGRPDVAIDLIPADFVVNAMIAALADIAGTANGRRVYQCASSDRNPLLLRDLIAMLERAFLRKPMRGDDGKKIAVAPLRLVDQHQFVSSWERRLARLTRWRSWVEAIGPGRLRARKWAAISRQIEQVVYFAKIYSPYTHLDCRFADDNTRALRASLHADDLAEFPFDVERIDWSDYVVHRHVPGVRSFVLGTGPDPLVDRESSASHDRESSRGLRAAAQAETIFDAFRRSASIAGEKPALQICRGGRWLQYTYGDVLRATGAISRRFVELGLTAGDVIALCGENGPEWGLTYLAAMRAGLTVSPLDPQLPADEAWAAARFVRARLMCAGNGVHETLRAKRRSPDPPIVALRDPFLPAPGASLDPAPPSAAVSALDVASILFTSGTTVSPRAVPLTHRNLLANATSLLKVHPVYSGDSFLSVLPLYHVFEFTAGFLVPMLCGATVTYVEQLKGPEIVANMQASGTTVMLVVPRLLRSFHDAIAAQVAASGRLTRGVFRFAGFVSRASRNRLGRLMFGRVHRRFGGRLRMFVSGGSRLEPEYFHAFRSMGFAVHEGYGLTETSPVLSVNPPSRCKAGSVGTPLPGIELELRNCNLEGVGEVWVKGPNVMDGYLRNPEATEEVLVDGWLRTGDLGRLDEEGFLFLTGRTKDLIITGAGKNVYPDEVELRYRNLPYAKEICVFGMPSRGGLGDAVHAVIVLDEQADPDLDRSSKEREIRLAVEQIGEKLPPHQRISTLHFWDKELPKTSTLKARRGLIRETVERGVIDVLSATHAVSSTVRSDREKAQDMCDIPDSGSPLPAVRRILARCCKRPESAIPADAHLLLDLGIDSIGKIDVLGSVEDMFGLSIDDATAAKIARVSDLLRLIGNRSVNLEAEKKARKSRKHLVDAVGGEAHVNGRVSAPVFALRWLAGGFESALMRGYIHVRVHGRENLPREGAFILAPNHCSHLDALSVKSAVGALRRVWVAGAEDYFFSSAFRRFLFGRVLDTIPFDRRADGMQGLRRCAEALRRGDGLIFFPEGTRSRTGRLQPFRSGVALLALEHNAPIVPVFIANAFELMPKGRRFPKPGEVKVTLGEPIVPPELVESTDSHAVIQDLAFRLRTAVSSMADARTHR